MFARSTLIAPPAYSVFCGKHIPQSAVVAAPHAGRYTRECVPRRRLDGVTRPARRADREAEGARLEIVCAALNRTQGSNPWLSATELPAALGAEDAASMPTRLNAASRHGRGVLRWYGAPRELPLPTTSPYSVPAAPALSGVLHPRGEVAEWLNAAVSKADQSQLCGGPATFRGTERDGPSSSRPVSWV